MALAQLKEDQFVLFKRGPSDCVKPRPTFTNKEGEHNKVVSEALDHCAKQSENILISLSKV
ncbi:MAG: hypothetical protein ACJARF_001058 [Alteromonadaceae bacterium]|jgi:hypothetical protein